MSDGLKLIAKILEEGATTEFRGLQLDMFLDAERQVFQYVQRHYRRHGSLPNIDTVMDDTGQDLPETPENVSYYRDRVSDRHTYNALRGPFSVLRESLASSNIEEARQAISQLQTVSRVTSTHQDLRNIKEVGEGRVEHSEEQRHYSGELSGITTGWPILDDRTGGWQNGDLITWAARPAMGKTYYLLHQALAAWRSGKSVLVVSMEMTLDQLGNRLVGMMSGINPRVIRDGRLSTRIQPRLHEAVAGIENEGRFHLYAGNFRKNVEDTENLILEMTPDIVYIDGVYLMTTAKGFKKSGRYDVAADVFDYLKEMTIIHHRPIVCTTKFAKGAGKKGADGSLETIGYTDAVSTHSSLVLGLKEGESPHQETQRIIEIMKGREGEEGAYRVNFSFKPMNFSQVGGNTEVRREDRQREVRERRERSGRGREAQGWTSTGVSTQGDNSNE